MTIYFCIYAFIGYCIESIYRSLIERKWISSGILDCPFIPLYGIGAVCLIFYKSYFHYNAFIGGLFLVFIELISSYYIEYTFKIKYWNYEKHIFNFQGRICLLYSGIWILMTYIFYNYLHPFISQFTITNNYTTVISIFVIIYILIKTKKRISQNLS